MTPARPSRSTAARSSAVSPTTAWHGDARARGSARRPRRRPCPRAVWSSSRPSPVITARAAAARRSKPTASSTNAAPGTRRAPRNAQRPPERPPAQPVIGTPRGSRGASSASRSRRSVEPPTVAGSAPFCGPKTAARPPTWCARRRRPRARPRSRPRRAPPGAGAAVGRGAAADGDDHRACSGRGRRGDQLARAAGRGAPWVALVLGHQADPARLRHLHHPATVGQEAELGLDRPAERVGDGRGAPLAAERVEENVERALAAVGDRQALGLDPRLAQRRRRSRRRPRRPRRCP